MHYTWGKKKLSKGTLECLCVTGSRYDKERNSVILQKSPGTTQVSDWPATSIPSPTRHQSLCCGPVRLRFSPLRYQTVLMEKKRFVARKRLSTLAGGNDIYSNTTEFVRRKLLRHS